MLAWRAFSKTVQEEVADVTFLIENQELQSSSKRLIKSSPVFASMLEGGFAEAESKRVTIEDATFDEFSSFIRALLDGAPITEKNVESLHRLSDKYYTAELLQRCREFVWKSGMNVLQKFVVAEKWDDALLLQKLTGEIGDADTLKRLEAGGMMTELKPSTLSLILKKGFSFI
ncbi:CBN-BATH-25 protein [Aphelenchoides avenae]|nr:CBN-BATH-25 protein [Aphelenchus avenae]